MQAKLRFLFFLLIAAIIFSPVLSLAQQLNVTCQVADKNDVPIPYAAIQVYSIADSAHVHFEATADSVGRATFNLDSGGQYTMRMYSVGYKPTSRNIWLKGRERVFVLRAEQDAAMLKEAGVTYKKPLLRQEDDKTIVDPEELAASSTSAYDIMEKIPGIFVDQDGNIYISSTTPATIYINGREQKMSNSDVAAILKSLPPGSIEKIEILRTPSARYDASSSGGIVNVVLKKGVRIGLTGNVNAGINQGTYGNRFAGVVINNNNGVFTTNFTVQASERSFGEQLKTDRIFAPDSMLSQDSYTRYPTRSCYGSYSIGYTPNKKWDLNWDGRVTLSNNLSQGNNPSDIEKISSGQQSVVYVNHVDNDAHNLNISQGLSAKYKWDTAGSEWTTDLSFTYAPVHSIQSYNTAYTVPFAAITAGNGDINSDYRYFSARTDVVEKLPGKTTVEAGLKATDVWFNNRTNYTISSGGATTNDAQRTGSYNYDEHIYAAYIQASHPVKSVTVKAGVRVENTNMNGYQITPFDTSFKISRTDFFPYLYISRKVTTIASYELRSYLIYRRTITRPAYDYLNPFPKYIDQYLSEAGNPSLRPQFTNNYEANVSVDDRPIFAIGYNDVSDLFSQVIYQADSSHRQSYRTYDNLGKNKELYLRGLGAIPPGKTYFFVLGAQYNHNIYEGYYNGQPLSYEHGSWTFFTYQTLKLGKLTQLVLNGFLRYKSQIQFYELSTFGSLNLSINHQFLDKKLKVTASVSDMFLTNNNHFSIDQGNTMATGLRKGDTRRFGLNATYNFGIKKKEEHNFLNEESPEGKQ